MTIAPPDSAWLLSFAPRPRARARLFCFPHAGVGASAYRLWPRHLPEELELWAIQPPGRESRLREPPMASIPALARSAAQAMAPLLDLPFALFGHSMGAVVAAEVARAIHGGAGPHPRHLLVSGRRPPHLPPTEPPLHPLPDPEFVAEIGRRYGGIHPEVLAQPELLELLLPALRADILALELHRPPPRPPLPCPISAFGGAEDRLIPREHLEAWRGETSGAFRVRVFPGGHFYLDARRAELLADVAAALAPLTGAAHREATA